MNRDVVIVGCGFIGKIKAQIWNALEMNVFVYDIDKEKEAALIQMNPQIQSFTSYPKKKNPAIVDIATPNNRHGDALVWVARHIPHPQVILIEKPICSTEQEKYLLEKTLASFPEARVFVNETYYWSEALTWLSKVLQEKRESPKAITINLSKNRLADVSGGRFFDKELQAYGIEMPHAVAILQVLGFEVFDAKVRQNIQYIDRMTQSEPNQGVHVELRASNGAIAYLNSFLGDFYAEREVTLPNTLTRSVVVDTTSERYTIEFDPVEGVARYMSRVTIESTGQVILIEDNHLMNHMRHVRDLTINSKIANLLSAQNSFEIYEFLSTLAQTAHVTEPNNLEADFIMGREKD